ncbi:MAG: hypothetical protein JXR12_15390 [Neptunomonas phycophila]|uniref:hypothetical protein n=1 Tax=Neptunomonas phycophila TaxID=1572645 RepID=UPI003B8C0F51
MAMMVYGSIGGTGPRGPKGERGGRGPRGHKIDLANELLRIQLRPQAVGVAVDRPYQDIMPDLWDDEYGGFGPKNSYTPPPRNKRADEIRQKLKKGPDRNREFKNEGDSGLTVVYQVTKFRWRQASAERVKDRIYSLLADRTRVDRQRVIDEHESWFNYEMIVEIKFKKASLIKQFEELVRKTGAKVEEVK